MLKIIENRFTSNKSGEELIVMKRTILANNSWDTLENCAKNTELQDCYIITVEVN